MPKEFWREILQCLGAGMAPNGLRREGLRYLTAGVTLGASAGHTEEPQEEGVIKKGFNGKC